MSNDLTIGTAEDMLCEVGVPAGAATADAPPEAEVRELWRIISVDGSTRIFQTKPLLEPAGKRAGRRPVTACDLNCGARAGSLFDQKGDAAVPALVTENTTPLAAQTDAELSVQLTSVTQAWPSLSPGIRGAVMALIRAASTARQTRPAAAPRLE